MAAPRFAPSPILARNARALHCVTGSTRDQIIAVGDGANDLKFMAEAGVSIAYHAKPLVRENAYHAINYIGLDGVLHLFN